MMIRDNQLQTEPAGLFGLSQRADAAVDGDDYRGTCRGDLPQGFDVEPVALLEAVGHVEIGRGAEQVQELPEEGGASCAVDIVVAVNTNTATFTNRVEKAVGGLA